MESSRQKYRALDYTVEDLAKDTGANVCASIRCLALTRLIDVD